MRIFLTAVTVAVVLAATLLPAFANTPGNCNNLPRNQWAKCIIDQSAENGSQ